MSKRSRAPPGFYSSLFNDFKDECFNSKYRPKRKPVVMGIYEVDRVVAKKIRSGKAFYFVKWKNYPSTDNTWEPEDHLPSELISMFENPTPPSTDHLEEARERLAVSFEKGLKSKLDYEETLIMKHDVIRAIFPRLPLDLSATPHLADETELIDAGLAPFLQRYVTVTGGRCCVAMPVSIKLQLGRSPSFLDKEGKKAPSRPVEKVIIKFGKTHHAGFRWT